MSERGSEPFLRVRGIENKIHFAGPERAEDGGEQRCAVVHEETDGFGGGPAAIQYFTGDEIGAVVEFGVGPLRAGRANRDSLSEL
jgi:hypothetical protein